MPFGSLWLPGIVSAVAVWFLSAILHMVLKYHRADYRGLPDEESVGQAMRKAPPGPGVYFTPYIPDHSMLKDPAVRKRYEDGPVAMITVMRNGAPAMGKYLAMWFLFCLLVSFVAAYIARHTLDASASGLEVMRITGTIAFLGYGFGYFQDVIWKAVPWPNALRALFDAALYALTTGLVFRLLWPAA